MSLNNLPFSLDDIDVNTDLFTANINDTSADGADGTLVPDPDPGSLWFVRASFSGVSIGDDDFQDGFIYVNTSQSTNRTPADGDVAGIQKLADDSTDANIVETYVKGSDASEIAVGVHFPDAASDAYGEIGLTAVAVQLRRGHDISPKAFSPGQTVQTYDGTTALPADFGSVSMRTGGDGFGYCHVEDSNDDSAYDTVSYAAELSEYTNADNPVLGFEVRNTGNSGVNPSSWPDEYTALDEVGTLPQSSNNDSWPYVGYMPDNQELPVPQGGINQASIHDYEARAVVWEVGDRANTETYSSDTWEFQLSDPPSSLG